MRFLFYMGHPAHYHNVAVVAARLAARGHEVLFVARYKDVLFDLLVDCPHPVRYLRARSGTSLAGMAATVMSRELRMGWVAARFRPHLMVGTDIVITHVARLLGVPAILLNEDDAHEVPLLARLGFRYATAVLSPHCCDISPYEQKKIGYHGYHELAYLHPDYFTPDAARVASLLDGAPRYFILRFSGLSAHHDVGRTGITDELAERLIDRLVPRGRVYITSERALKAGLEPYRLAIDPRDIHHVLAHATLYVGDSQTMAAEAAVLGVPSLRFNDFVGRLSYLEELERRYGLTIGVPTDQPERLFRELDDLLEEPDVLAEWRRRRDVMLGQTIDVAAFFEGVFLEYAAGRVRPG